MPAFFQELMGETEGTRVHKKCNKQRMRELKTAALEDIADNISKRCQGITSPSIKKSSTFKAIVELKVSVDDYVLSAHDHNYRQQLLHNRTDDSVVSNETSCTAVPFRRLISNSMLKNLIKDLSAMKELELLNVTSYEDECLNQAFVRNEVMTDALINLQRHRSRKLRETFRKTLSEGIPLDNVHIFRHHFSNNKPMISMAFKIDPKKKDVHMVEALKKATELVPVCFN